MLEPTGFLNGMWLAFTKSILPLIPGAVGAAFALKFLGEALGAWQKITSFLTGLACAVYIAPLIIEAFSINSAKAQAGTEFLVGLFALATCRELFKEINEADLLGTIKRRYFGPKP